MTVASNATAITTSSSFSSGYPPVGIPMMDTATGKMNDVWSSWFQLFYNQWVFSATGSNSVAAQVSSQSTSLTSIQASITALQQTAVLQRVKSTSTAMSGGTTHCVAPYLISGGSAGDQYFSLAITPKSATSKLLLEVMMDVTDNSTASTLTAMIYQDSADGSSIGTRTVCLGILYEGFIYIRAEVPSVSTATKTFKVRAGSNAASGTQTFYVNNNFAVPSGIYITEYAS